MRPRLVTGWGRVGHEAEEVFAEDLAGAPRDAVLSRGLGRSYGDSSLPPPGRRVVNTTLADRILGFNEETGLLRAEAGLSLRALNRVLLGRRWFVPVTPGTQFVTLGGMIAADVHGKNHHVAGCFGEHVTRLTLKVADGRVIECSPQREPELFWATVGGMGLTGHILEAEVAMDRIPSPWIVQESERVDDIDAYIDALKSSSATWPFTVGWIDCLTRGAHMGRGILIKGRWAEPHEAPVGAPGTKHRLTVPFVLPGFAVSRPTVQAFNAAYYWKHLRRHQGGVVHPETFFYPLDAILHWNRIYGPRGMTQFQCVLPESAGRGAARRVLEVLTQRGGASFLCVIKDCGPEGRGLLSFPMPGISIALDIPIRDGTPALVRALNEQVIAEGGRIYLAKDNFTTADQFRRMEPRLDRFLAVRTKWDADHRFRSAQSVRVFGDPP